MKLLFAALSDVGRVRRDNQDSGYAGPRLLAVADGVGGAARGDIASSTAIAQVRGLDQPQTDGDPLLMLTSVLNEAHAKLTDLVEQDPALDGTSTTITVGLVVGEQLAIAHIGDSRAYLLRDGELRQLTSDHSFVQSLVDDGRITEEEARVHPNRNLILRALDGNRRPEPDTFLVDLEVGDRLLFSSDGCCGVLEPGEVAEILGQGTPDSACVNLVNASLDAGSTDNVTIVIGDVLADDAAADPEAAAALGPMLVGAAGEQARKGGMSNTGSLPPVAGAADDSATPLDPEEARYALRAPRRFAVLRRVLVAAVVLALIGAAAFFSYRWTQQQYFVAFDDSDDVAIFQGVNFELPGLQMHTVKERTSISRDQLPSLQQRSVDSGIGVASLEEAQREVAKLERLACPTPTPLPEATTSATSSPSTSPPSGPSTGSTSPATAPTKPGKLPGQTKAPSGKPLISTPSPSSTPAPNPDCGELG